VGRFIIWSEFRNVNSEVARWVLPRSMTTQLDFRSGEIVPNPWFPHCVQVNLLAQHPVVDECDLCVTLRRWCEQHCQGDVFLPYGAKSWPIFAFELDTDVMSFCLTWQDFIKEQSQ
jgi:hypothetical protein